MENDKKLNDLIEKAEKLFTFHPAPWRFYDNGFDGFVVDKEGGRIFGGEPSEGRVDVSQENLVSLVDTVNAIWSCIKGENHERT